MKTCRDFEFSIVRHHSFDSLCSKSKHSKSYKFTNLNSPNRYYFSRSSFYVFTEQIPIFQKPFFLATKQIQIFQEHFFLANKQILIFQEHIFSYRTDNDFPESLLEYQRTDRQFPGRFSPPNRYFSIRSWCLLSKWRPKI